MPTVFRDEYRVLRFLIAALSTHNAMTNLAILLIKSRIF